MKKLIKKIKQSPINYFSDLFIVVMVLGWVCAIPFIGFFAAYATIILKDVTLWSTFVELIAIPLTAGGALWMIKNGVQHALASKKGESCEFDFPDDEAIENEEEDEDLIG